MDGRKRVEMCQQMADDKRRLGLPLQSVRRIDNYLRNEWKIAPPINPDTWEGELARIAGPGLYARFKHLHGRQAGYLRRGKSIPQNIETRFYDLIADPIISGFIHSQKRTYILDSAALLAHLVSKLKIAGPILDVGCHIGYHTILLNRESGQEVHGIDLSKSAIAVAQKKVSQGVHIHFDNTPLESESLFESFDFVYAADSVNLNSRTLHGMSRTLKPNGVAVIMSDSCEGFDVNRSIIHAAGFGFGLADVTGGWIGDGRGFEARSVLVLVKGTQAQLPQDIGRQADSGWGYFKEYANAPDVPWDEKTQAFFRGTWIEDHPALPS